MKPIPLEDLVRLLGPTRDKKPAESTEASSESTELTQATLTANGILLPLEAVASLSVPTPALDRTGSHIVDITDQFIGRSLIITGVQPPKKSLTADEREEQLRKDFENIIKPPEKE